MTRPVEPEKMIEYRRGAELRRQTRARAVAERRARALGVAAKAAHILREEYGADRVVLFGSAGRADRFHARSDVDLAVRGIPPSQYLRAVGRLLALDSEITIDLVRMEEATPPSR